MLKAAQQIAISGHTRLIGFIGDPVDRARSPQNFNPRLAASGHDAAMVPIHVPAADFDRAIGGILAIANLDGLVVTMPFKERIMPVLHKVSARARAVGAVNAVRRDENGRLVGDIFDGDGFVGAARDIGLELQGMNVGLIGAGGAGAAIAHALGAAGIARLTIADRNAERASRLATLASDWSPIAAEAGPIDFGVIDLLVHATPMGMNLGDKTAIDTSALTAKTAVIDIVTAADTPLLRQARQLGCPNVGGAAMVAAQAVALMAYFGFPDNSGSETASN